MFHLFVVSQFSIKIWYGFASDDTKRPFMLVACTYKGINNIPTIVKLSTFIN